MSKPVGLLGGIFDPVHYGHLAAGRLAFEHFGLDRVVFIPAGVPPHKVTTVTASPLDRLSMLRIALRNETYAAIWDREVNRSCLSYTVDTLHELAGEYPDTPLYFIVGSDNLDEIHTWHHYKEILEMVTLCIAERPGYPMRVPPSLSTAIIRTFPSPCWGLSSTMLRNYVARGYQCRYLLPDGVREYIFKNGLYLHDVRKADEHICKEAH